MPAILRSNNEAALIVAGVTLCVAAKAENKVVQHSLVSDIAGIAEFYMSGEVTACRCDTHRLSPHLSYGVGASTYSGLHPATSCATKLYIDEVCDPTG